MQAYFFGRVNAIAGIFDFQNRGRLGRVESATTINQDFGACAFPENACIAGKRSLDLTVSSEVAMLSETIMQPSAPEVRRYLT